MGYRCEVLGQSNQVHQLQLLQKVTLMKKCDFCEDMSKSKNVKLQYPYIKKLPRVPYVAFGTNAYRLRVAQPTLMDVTRYF